jgi:hypothetical protein
MREIAPAAQFLERQLERHDPPVIAAVRVPPSA